MAFSESYKERDLKHYVRCDDDETGFRVHPVLLSELSEYLQFTLTGEKCSDSILRSTLILHLFLKQLCLLYVNTSWLEHRRNKIMLPFHWWRRHICITLQWHPKCNILLWKCKECSQIGINERGRSQRNGTWLYTNGKGSS